MNRLTTEKRARILNQLVEGASMRAITRIEKVGINTVTRLLEDAGEACAAYHDEHVRRVRAPRVQADEIWSFTYAKQKNVDAAKAPPDGAGDTWTWVAMDADAKLVISWLTGPRDGQSAYDFMMDLAERLAGRVQLTTDGLRVYVEAVEAAFGMDVDFAQLVKVYGDIPETERRYSTPPCKAAVPKVVQGDPNPADISTSYIERQNLTMRMSNRRYTRLTNAFSKKLRNHEHHNALHFVFYNFCRIHKTLRMTPAMAAGVTETLRDAEWIVGLIDARAAKPAKPGPKGPWKHKRAA